ncbi:DUF805 domain-containing protein [Arenibaculum pallidiluteum]|uniref:hypothetical protein n=1 Tax=Arenibaculum pallidiluteum TaxID=2812559 RepID=UPI001A97851C|nr:hypothetical protein [Arenibaculum pallidiluteum]
MSTLISLLFLLLLGWVLLAPLAVPAAWRLLRSEGRNGWYALLLFVPYAGFLALLLILQKPTNQTWAAAGGRNG